MRIIPSLGMVILLLMLTIIYLVLTEVTTEVHAGVSASMHNPDNIQAQVYVRGIGPSDFVSRPLSDGPFKPRVIHFPDPASEAMYRALKNFLLGKKYEETDFYKQEVVFDGILAVLNHEKLAFFANVHDCEDYEIKINNWLTGVTIIYDCSEQDSSWTKASF